MKEAYVSVANESVYRLSEDNFHSDLSHLLARRDVAS